MDFVKMEPGAIVKTSGTVGTTPYAVNIRYPDTRIQIEFGAIVIPRAAGKNEVNVNFLETFATIPNVYNEINTGVPNQFLPYTQGVNTSVAVIGVYNSGSAVSTGTPAKYFAIGTY